MTKDSVTRSNNYSICVFSTKFIVLAFKLSEETTFNYNIPDELKLEYLYNTLPDFLTADIEKINVSKNYNILFLINPIDPICTTPYYEPKFLDNKEFKFNINKTIFSMFRKYIYYVLKYTNKVVKVYSLRTPYGKDQLTIIHLKIIKKFKHYEDL